ncbi:MAG: ABC-type multidrug transport system, ATPase component [uncultured bacterium]|jgi:ABC-2 type transport system ATP-binding protein|nr:MAG: ABC-type multidrug transport system, ATPase component [uncultured bacterium]HLE76285.1 ABC transporter ATP-binding protein [Candidatus Babeliales bacterium]
MNNPLIQIQNISKIYRSKTNPVIALDNVSITINRGEVLGLLGVNGAGKTTLSSILATLHPPTSGSILFNGTSIYSDIVAYRRALGFCPQTQNLDTYLTVEQNLLFAGRYFLMPENEIISRTKQLMEELELTRYASFEVDTLSGGNKQRLLIARALMHNPQLVILDEPTVGLDPDIRKKLWNIIRGLKNRGVTVILTTHYLDEAEYLSDRICMLHRGKVMLIESVESLKKQHHGNRLEDIFIELIEDEQSKEA